MSQSMMIILFAIVGQAHAKGLAMNAKEPSTNHMGDAHDITDKLTEKLISNSIDKLIGTSAMLPTANKPMPLLARHPLKKVYAAKNSMAVSSMTPQKSLLPSRRQSSPLPSRRQWSNLKNRYDETMHSRMTRAGAAAVAVDGGTSDDGKKVDITSQVFNLVKN